jgi:hypothetical protein
LQVWQYFSHGEAVQTQIDVEQSRTNAAAITDTSRLVLGLLTDMKEQIHSYMRLDELTSQLNACGIAKYTPKAMHFACMKINLSG